MRIAMSGAAGTGKTTLANFIHEKYGWPINPVGSRSVSQAMGFASPYDVDAAGKRVEFQRRLFEEKREWETKHESFVTDRTHLDNLVYASMHGAAHSVELDEYLEALNNYTMIFLCPIRSFHNIGTDPVRMKDTGYHVIYDLFLRGLVDSELDIGCFYIEQTEWETRKDYVEKQIEAVAYNNKILLK